MPSNFFCEFYFDISCNVTVCMGPTCLTPFRAPDGFVWVDIPAAREYPFPHGKTQRVLHFEGNCRVFMGNTEIPT